MKGLTSLEILHHQKGRFGNQLFRVGTIIGESLKRNTEYYIPYDDKKHFKFILSLYRLLKKSGKISITLPCDPGFLWQSGRLFNYLTFWKFKNISKKEYFYHMAHEHINSIQNLIAILKYNFSNFKETFLPFRVKSINFNLMYNIVVTK